tara:strand:+ start:90 stop:1094 length:1005 start_codon:yes stop_codon:yes gene_type:complete
MSLKISIITPSYNQGEFIEQTIRSVVIDQNYNNIEYIVIDGGSSDRTVDILKKYDDKIHYWISEPDKGQTDAINKGFAKATGDIVTWLCSDDYYEPGVFHKVLKAFKQNPTLNLVCGNRRTFGKGYLDRVYPGANIKSRIEDTLLFGGFDQPPSFFRADAYKRLFPLTEELKYRMDCELFLRYELLYGQDKLKHFDEYWAHGRMHLDSKSVNGSYDSLLVENAVICSIAKAIVLDGSLDAIIDALPKYEPYSVSWNVEIPFDVEYFKKRFIDRFKPHIDDPSKVFRDLASYHFFLGNKGASINCAKEALKLSPFSVKNIKTLLFALRNTPKPNG